MPRSLALNLTDTSRIGEARRLAAEMAQGLDFTETEVSQVRIVAAEAATNLIKYAHQGEILLRTLAREGFRALEILALDRGPGIADLSRSLEDGYSTAGSPGTGLGAIRRLSSVFDIYSQPGKGTALVAQIWARGVRRPSAGLEIGAVCVAKQGELACGDVWAAQTAAGRNLILLADGLGHGPLAAQAADEAVRVLEAGHPERSPKEILESAHGALRSTRGASVSVAEIRLEQSLVRYAGVGNIAGSIQNGSTSRSLISHNGTVGHAVPRIQEFSQAWARGSVLILHSDGLNTRWQLESYPGLMLRHPALVAGVLYRDFQRGRDDVTVVVAREA